MVIKTFNTDESQLLLLWGKSRPEAQIRPEPITEIIVVVTGNKTAL